MVTDRFATTRPHPLLAEERLQRDLSRRSIASLSFEVDVPAPRGGAVVGAARNGPGTNAL